MRFSFFCLLLFAQQLFAGNENFPCGARFMSLSDATVSIDDPFAWSHNQAGLARQTSPAASVCYRSLYQTGLSLKAFGISAPWLKGVWNFNASLYGYENYHQNKYGLCYSKAFGKNIFLGAQFDGFNTFIPDYGSSTHFTGEAGVLLKLFPRLDFGAHVFNPFHVHLSDERYEAATEDMQLGFSYHLSEKVTGMMELDKDVRYPTSLKMGLEYLPLSYIALRGGFASANERFSFGFGFQMKALNMDLAVAMHPLLGIETQFSIVYDFSKVFP